MRVSPEENERQDEALLRAGTPAVRVAVLDRAALSVGVGVPRGTPCLARARNLGLPIVPRSTGGTSVLFGRGDLLWSIVLPRGDPRVGRTFTNAYGRLGAPLVRWLSDHSVESSWEPAPNLSRECCLLGERGQVLQTQQRVVSGAAQHATDRALLHHGTLPRTIDRPTHRAVFAEDDPRLFDRLIGTDDLGLEAEPETLRDELARAFEAFLGAGRAPY